MKTTFYMWLIPFHLAVNKPLKDQMKQQFHHGYAKQVQKKTKDLSRGDDRIIDLYLGKLKPLGLQW